ncbi:MAG: TolC family protein [Verrucomicrobia bacterium]|nr:MAG: TolC family protein [Verrucomicrobiota bacterium]
MKRKLFLNYLLCIGVTAATTLPSCAAGPKRGAAAPQPGGKQAVAGGSLTLEEAIRLALHHNPQLEASAARKEAAVGRAVQARAWTNPALELSADDVPTRRGGLSQSKNMAGITQVVPYPGKKSADRQIGAADAAAGAAEWRLSRAELVREVKIAYCQVQLAERTATVAADLVRVADAAATAAAKRNAAGEIALQEQLRAEIQLEQSKSEKIDAARQTAVARQELARLLGMPDLSAAQLTGAPDESGKLALVHGAASAILAGHPAMVAARARRDQALATVRRAGLEPRPDVTVGVAAGRDGAANENQLAFRLSIPLPLFDRSKGKQLEARAGLREAEADIAATRQELLTAWRSAVASYQAAAAQVAAHRERILPKSELALQLVQTGFDEGKFTFIDYLDVQRTTAEVRLAYQKKLFELNSARAELEAMAEAAPAN